VVNADLEQPTADVISTLDLVDEREERGGVPRQPAVDVPRRAG
jgi:hypothetical protein